MEIVSKGSFHRFSIRVQGEGVGGNARGDKGLNFSERVRRLDIDALDGFVVSAADVVGGGTGEPFRVEDGEVENEKNKAVLSSVVGE